MKKEELLLGLNDKQKEAVEYINGPLLILAGAGSGKTRVLTHRVGYLIEEGISPWNILAITFTNKAANEMKERVEGLLDANSAQYVFVSTFHSMCVRLLRRDIDKIGYKKDFTIYDTEDQRTLIRGCIKKLNLDTKIYKERAILSIISANKNEMTDAEEFENNAGDFYDRNVARIYGEYEKELKENNALDFDDLLIKTVELFGSCPEVLGYWQERFKYIMVDEYQDTNNVQFEIVRLLSLKYKNLCVVGDDDQSIYKFRGANIENILSFERTFPGTKVIKLEQNYRSTKSILNAANELIRNNISRKEKSLWTDNEEGELPVYREYERAAEEADEIIRQAASNAAKGCNYKNQAVLYRTNAQSRLLEEKCISRDIPYIIVGGVNFYQRKEIKDMLSYLRVIANGTDDLSCRRVVNVPKRGIGQTSIDRIQSFAEKNSISFYQALLQCDEVPGIGSAAGRIEKFTEFIEELKRRLSENELSLKELIETVGTDGGYYEEIKKDDPVTAETRMENIEELINKAVSFEEEQDKSYDISLLAAFLEEVSLVADIDRTNNSDDVLTMMTLHAAKGLEFDTVFMCGMEDGLFPSVNSINADDPEAEIAEERRLCYVGITRAKRRLFLSSSKERMINGEMHRMKPSRFIDEIPDKMAKKHFKEKRLDYDKPTFSGFGGYEGRMEYSAYNSFNTDNFSGGLYGSLDTSSVGRSKRGSSSLLNIPGLKKGFGAADQKAIKKKPDYKVGDRVRHIKFGMGTVTVISDEPKDYKVTVEFDEVGIKTMYAGFARLEKCNQSL